MFSVTATFSFLNANGSPAKDPVIEKWNGLEKMKVIDQLEDRFLEFLLKLNQVATDVGHGRVEKPSTTNPVEVQLEALITEDGKKWSRTVFEWPNMGEEQQAMMLGLFYGEMATLDKDTADKKESKSKQR